MEVLKLVMFLLEGWDVLIFVGKVSFWYPTVFKGLDVFSIVFYNKG